MAKLQSQAVWSRAPTLWSTCCLRTATPSRSVAAPALGRRFGAGVQNDPRGAESVDKLHGHVLRDYPGLGPALQLLLNGSSSAFAVILSPMIDVHAHERVGLASVQAASKTHGMVESSVSML